VSGMKSHDIKWQPAKISAVSVFRLDRKLRSFEDAGLLGADFDLLITTNKLIKYLYSS
jgi:hypothetical protein